MLSDADIREFQELYRTVKGQKISFIEAQREANKLYLFYKAIYRPIPKLEPLAKGGDPP